MSTDPTATVLAPIETHLAECLQMVKSWLADETLIPDINDVKRIRETLATLLQQPLQVITTTGEQTISLATVDALAPGLLPPELEGKMRQLQAQVVLFDQDLAQMSEKLKLLHAANTGQTCH